MGSDEIKNVQWTMLNVYVKLLNGPPNPIDKRTNEIPILYFQLEWTWNRRTDGNEAAYKKSL